MTPDSTYSSNKEKMEILSSLELPLTILEKEPFTREDKKMGHVVFEDSLQKWDPWSTPNTTSISLKSTLQTMEISSSKVYIMTKHQKKQ